MEKEESPHPLLVILFILFLPLILCFFGLLVLVLILFFLLYSYVTLIIGILFYPFLSLWDMLVQPETSSWNSFQKGCVYFLQSVLSILPSNRPKEGTAKKHGAEEIREAHEEVPLGHEETLHEEDKEEGRKGEEKHESTFRGRLASAFSLGKFFGFGIILPIVDVVTDFLYLSSFLKVSLEVFPDYPEEIRELSIWKMVAILSTSLGLFVTIFSFAFFIYRMATSKSPTKEALWELIEDFNGKTLKPGLSFFVWVKMVGSLGEDLLQVIVISATMGYQGFQSYEIASLVTSLLSIAFGWATFSYRFFFPPNFDNPFTVPVRAVLTVTLFLTLLPSFLAFYFVPHFSYFCRPHQLESDFPHMGLKPGILSPCSGSTLYRLAPDFDYSEIHWKKAHFNVSIHGVHVEEISFPFLKEYSRNEMEISDCPHLKEINFPEARVISFLVLDSLPQFNTLSYPSAFELNLVLRNMSSLHHLSFSRGSLDYFEAADNPNLEVIDFEDYDLDVARFYSNPHLSVINFFNLGAIGSLEAESNQNLKTVDAPLLATMSKLTLYNNTCLQNISIESLQFVSTEINISENSDLTDIAFPFLERIGYSSYFKGRIGIFNNTALTTISFPSLNELNGNLNVQGNPNLQKLELSSLTLAQAEILNLSAGVSECLVVFKDASVGCGNLHSLS